MTTTALPVEPGTKDFYDLRDRAAYVHITGAMPTHLRSYMTSLLSKIAGFTGQSGRNSLEVARQNAAILGLDSHPMVKRTREYVKDGYNIAVARDIKARRPYGKVFLWKQEGHEIRKVTIQHDGGVLLSW